MLFFSNLSTCCRPFVPTRYVGTAHSPGTGQTTSQDETRTDVDGVALSPVASSIASSGLDVMRSSVWQTAAGLEFDLTFNASGVVSISAAGILKTGQARLDLSLTFRFQQVVLYDGKEELHTFEARMNLQADNVQNRSIQLHKNKEDITTFVRRLVADLGKVAREKNTRLVGVVFSADDLADLFQMDNGRLAQQVINLIQMVFFYTQQVKHLQEERVPRSGGVNTRDVMLTPQRKESGAIVVEQSEVRLNHVSFQVEDVTRVSEKPAAEIESHLIG